jgi:hypothetical protein
MVVFAIQTPTACKRMMMVAVTRDVSGKTPLKWFWEMSI